MNPEEQLQEFFAAISGRAQGGMSDNMLPALSVENPIPDPGYLQLLGPSNEVEAEPSQPGIVDLEKALQLTPEEIVRQVMDRREESAQHRRALESTWRMNLDLYHGLQDWGHRAPWQSKIFLPLIYSKIETTKSLLKTSLLSSRQFFGLDGDAQFTQSGQQRMWEDLILYQLEEARWIPPYLYALGEGLLYGLGAIVGSWDRSINRSPRIEKVPSIDPNTGYPILGPDGVPLTSPRISIAEKLVGKFSVRAAPCWALYPDPYAPDAKHVSYIVEEMAQDEAQLEDGMRAGIYQQIDDLGSPVPWDLEYEKRSIYTELPSRSPGGKRKRHLLTIYHGDFYDADGKRCLQNWRAIVANKTKLIAFGPNENFTGQLPYVLTTPLPYPGRPWGRDAIGPASDMQLELNSLVNLAIDAQVIASMPAVEVDVGKLVSPLDASSIEPGKAYPVFQGGAFNPIQVGNANNQIWTGITELKQAISVAMQVNEFIEGAPTTKGRPSATEVTQKSGAAEDMVQNMAADLESSDLVELVNLVYGLSLQNLDDASEPGIEQILARYPGYSGQMLSDPAQRLELLQAKFRVRVRGLSVAMRRRSMQQTLMQVLQIGMEMGIPDLNSLMIFYQLLQASDVDPEQVGMAPSYMDAMIAAMQQQRLMAGGTGGGGAGSSSSASAAPPPGPPSPSTTAAQVQQET